MEAYTQTHDLKATATQAENKRRWELEQLAKLTYANKDMKTYWAYIAEQVELDRTILNRIEEEAK